MLLTEESGAGERLRRFARTLDGFKIAELDLQERGMGELAGAKQHGGFRLRYASLVDDADLVERTRETALAMIAGDPRLERPEHAALRAALERRHQRGIELFRVG